MRLRSTIPFVLFTATVLFACANDGNNQACERNSQCPANFVCDEGLCVEACEFDTNCGSGEICRSGYCVAGVRADTGTSDGDAADASPDLGQPNGIGPDGQPVYGASYGEACSDSAPCRPGLSCSDDACAADGSSEAGEPCTIAEECGDGLTCSVLAQCATSPELPIGSLCTDPSECAAGLRCEFSGLVGLCEADGDGDLGFACEANSECLGPLVCDATETCQIPAFAELRLYDGIDCAERDENAEFKVFFEIPGEEAPAEFFRLPYPNDVRRTAEGVDLAGFGSPGPNLPGGDLIDTYIDAIENGGRGFSTNPTTFFRFSREYDFDSIQGGGDTPTLRFVNIDPDSDNFGRGQGMSWFMTNGRKNFICHNWLSIRSSWNSPLEHDTTYAVFLTTAVSASSDGVAPVQDSDFAAMLAESAPDDERIASAWELYAPFRAYLETENISTSSIAGATVFTTMDPDAEMPAVREAIRSRTVEPELNDLTLCADGETSPCDDGVSRACINRNTGFLEVHATYRAPIYQEGTRPYLTLEDGGGLEFNESGVLQSQGAEEMCLSMAIPDGEMPEEGWPVILYAHGTGGDFLTHIRNGPASDLTEFAVGEERARFVVVGIDGVQHGPRRGDSVLDPELLFFNFPNPDAALGNVQQGAADYFYLSWLLEVAEITSGDSPTGEALAFDESQFYFFGHSQGATVGVPFVANEPLINAAVFSGAGGSLVLSLLGKTNPIDIASSVELVLNDGSLSDNHPVLNLLQQFIDPVDPLNYANPVFRSPFEGHGPRHVFQPYGLNDTYTPNRTQQVLGAAMGLQVAEPVIEQVSGLREVTLPATGNRRTTSIDVTAVMIQYEPEEDEDGHFVSFRDADAQRQIQEFFGTALLNEVPTLSP